MMHSGVPITSIGYLLHLLVYRDVLLDETKSMYERYAALFALRNLGEEEATSAIVESLGANSALLRHEVRCQFCYH